VKAAGDAWAFRDDLRRDLRAALKSRQHDRVSALRTLIAAIDNAEATQPDAESPRSVDGVIAHSSPGVGSSEAPRRALAMSDVDAIVRDLLCEYQTQGEQYRSMHQHDAADRLERKASILRTLLAY
jgi:hypothetical protein